MGIKGIKKKSIAMLLILTILASLVTIPSIAAENVTVTITGTNNYDKANDVLKITNQLREDASIDDLVLDSSLCDYAMQRAAELALNFSHTRPNGSLTLTQYTDSGIKIDNENIAAGYTTAESVMEAWMSDEHSIPIMSSSYKSIGIGCYITDTGIICWVQVFSTAEAKEVSSYSGTASKQYTVEINPDVATITLKINGLNDETSITVGEEVSPTKAIVTSYNASFITATINLSDITWTSSDTNIFTVDTNGTVTGKSEGTATLTASLGNYSKDYTIVVTPEKGISLNKSTSTLWVDDTDNLTVTYIPEDSSSEQGTISWESDNPTVASVDNNGKVTALSKGIATITATTSTSGKTASCEVTVKQPYTEISLNKTSITMDKSTTEKLTVETVPETADESAEIQYNSSDNHVVTVSDDGTITAVGTGTATITVTMTTSSTGKTFTATCDVTVQAHIENIVIENGDIELYKGQTEELEVSFNPTEFVESKALTWESSNENVAVVTQDDQGNTIVQAIAPGNAVIKATTVNGIYDEIVVTVPEVKIDTLILNKKSTSIEKGETETLVATILPENTTDDTTITWESEDSSIATVDENGVVTAVSPGTTKIIATTTSGLSVECEVTVTCTLESISLNSESESIIVNGNRNTVQLTVNKEPEDADPSIDDVVWTSENESVATVDENGVVTAVSPGTAIITATLDGKTATCTITVDVELESVTIENQDKVLELLKKQSAKLEVIINPENTTIEPTATWTSSDESVATVNENGLVTAVGIGSATITVDYGNGITASRDIEVTEITANSISINNIIESMLINDSVELGFTLNPADATDDVTWISSDENILTVDENGIVTAVGVGTATITVQTTNGISDSIEITVTEKHIKSIDITLGQDTIAEGNCTQLEVTINPADYTDTIESILYTVSNPSIATIDENGLVTGLKAGEVILIVSVNAKQADGTINTITSQILLNVTEVSESEPANSDDTENNETTTTVNGEESTSEEVEEIVESLTTSPHTGDMNIVALVTMMVISLIGMILIIKKK